MAGHIFFDLKLMNNQMLSKFDWNIHIKRLNMKY